MNEVTEKLNRITEVDNTRAFYTHEYSELRAAAAKFAAWAIDTHTGDHLRRALDAAAAIADYCNLVEENPEPDHA